MHQAPSPDPQVCPCKMSPQVHMEHVWKSTMNFQHIPTTLEVRGPRHSPTGWLQQRTKGTSMVEDMGAGEHNSGHHGGRHVSPSKTPKCSPSATASPPLGMSPGTGRPTSIATLLPRTRGSDSHHHTWGSRWCVPVMESRSLPEEGGPEVLSGTRGTRGEAGGGSQCLRPTGSP